MKSKLLIFCFMMIVIVANAGDYYQLFLGQPLFKEPSVKSEMLMDLKANDTLKVISTLDGWTQVQTLSGVKGYIFSTGCFTEIQYDPNSSDEMPIAGKVLLITLVVIVIGIILGFTRFVTIYSNYTDLAITFAVVILLIISLPFSLQLGNTESKLHPIVPYIFIGVDTALLIWVLVRAMKQNNVATGILAFIVKIPLVIAFLYYLFKMFSAERIRDKVDGGIKAGLLALLMNGLVKVKEWKSNNQKISI